MARTRRRPGHRPRPGRRCALNHSSRTGSSEPSPPHLLSADADRRPALLSWCDVLVASEGVRRVPSSFEAAQALVLRVPVRGADAVLPVVADEIQVDAPARVVGNVASKASSIVCAPRAFVRMKSPGELIARSLWLFAAKFATKSERRLRRSTSSARTLRHQRSRRRDPEPRRGLARSTRTRGSREPRCARTAWRAWATARHTHVHTSAGGGTWMTTT